MAENEFTSSKELLERLTEDLERTQRQVLSILMSDAEKTIREKSGGRLVPEPSMTDDKFLLMIPHIPEDPGDAVALKVEKETQAFASAYKNLKDESYTKNLLERELK